MANETPFDTPSGNGMSEDDLFANGDGEPILPLDDFVTGNGDGAADGGAFSGGSVAGDSVPGGSVPGGSVPGGSVPGVTGTGGSVPGGTSVLEGEANNGGQNSTDVAGSKAPSHAGETMAGAQGGIVTAENATATGTHLTSDLPDSGGQPKHIAPSTRTINFGNSILGRPLPNQSSKDKLLAKQRELANKFKKQNVVQPPAEPSGTGDQDSSAAENIDNSFEPAYDFKAQAERQLEGFRILQAQYNRKKKAGTITNEEEISFLKLEAKEKARLRKLAADMAFDETPEPEDADDPLFEPTLAGRAQDFSTLYSDEEEDSGPKRRKRAPHKRKSRADIDSNVDDDNSDAEPQQTKPRKRARATTGAAKKKGRKAARPDYTDQDFEDIIRASADKAKTKGKKTEKGASKKAKQSRGGRSSGPNMTNMNFYGTNVFDDAEQVKDLRNQPSFQNTARRDNALKQLIASLPEEDRREGHSDMRALNAAMRDFTGQGSVVTTNDGWIVKGMKTPLKHYQIMGAAFMRRRENSEQEPRGGILADQMGLGKTLMSLANIINGKAPDKEPVRATLIVAAPALVAQWDAEIEKHCASTKDNKKHGLGVVMHYHARSRVKSNNLESMLMSADIVLTTYAEVARSYPKAIIPAELTTALQKDEWWRQYYEDNRGVFHRIKFHRIVIDEAQAIKNHKGHTSMAVRAIEARFHWAITGTPIMNSIKEFYPYFKFLREPHTGSFKIFSENFCTPDDPEGVERLTVFLRKFMVRRTHIDTLFGARLLDLPTPKEHTIWLEFNEVERTVYEIVKSRMIARINQMSRTEGIEKNYGSVWTMILRLRQLCGHVLLIQQVLTDVLEREDFEKLNQLTASEGQISGDSIRMLAHLRHVLKNSGEAREVSASIGEAVITSSQTLPSGIVEVDETQDFGGKHGTSYHFKKYLDDLIHSEKWQAIEDRTTCSSCRMKPHQPVVTSCHHIYCRHCLEILQHSAARRGHDAAKCSECGSQFTSVSDVQEVDTYHDDNESMTPSVAGGGKNSKKGQQKKKKRKDPLNDWIGMKGEILPSAKTAACKVQIQHWLAEKPMCKIIIYTQFLPIVRILAKVCQTEKWQYVTYTGAMSHEARAKAIQEFSDQDQKYSIMLASLRCGGLGLNLTMASRVICFDPWWNESVEQQAFCRVFRIGQTEKTEMTRFVIKHTIDAAMMALKERKQIEIDEVMNSKDKKLDVKELMRLFGDVQEDAQGRPFIFAEGGGETMLGQAARLPALDSDDEDANMGQRSLGIL